MRARQRRRAPAIRKGETFDKVVHTVEGRLGLAGGRSGSVKILFEFLIRTLLGLRRQQPRAPAGRRALAGRSQVSFPY